MAGVEGASVGVAAAAGVNAAPSVGVATAVGSAAEVSTVSGFAPIEVGPQITDTTISANPLTDPGWADYSLSANIDIFLDTQAPIPSSPPEVSLANYDVLAEAGKIAQAAWESTEPAVLNTNTQNLGTLISQEMTEISQPELGVSPFTDVAGKTSNEIDLANNLERNNNTDEAVAQKVESLALELGLPEVADHAKGIVQDRQELPKGEPEKVAEELINEAKTDEVSKITIEPDQKSQDKSTEKAKEDVKTEEKKEPEKKAEEKPKQKDDEKKEEEKEKKKKKEENKPRILPRVDANANARRGQALIQAAAEEKVNAWKESREVSPIKVAEKFENLAQNGAKSTILFQLNMQKPDETIRNIAHEVQGTTSDLTQVVQQGIHGIQLHTAVVLAADGIQVPESAVEKVLGIRRGITIQV